MTIAPSAPAAESAVEPLLATLDPEQRAAATLPDGPTLVIAPAGSGKTTTLIARLGVLRARGVPPDRIGVVTFNREAAEELASRIATRLAPHSAAAETIEVRALHAMARQVLLDAGRPVRLLPDRLPCCAPPAAGRWPRCVRRPARNLRIPTRGGSAGLANGLRPACAHAGSGRAGDGDWEAHLGARPGG